MSKSQVTGNPTFTMDTAAEVITGQHCVKYVVAVGMTDGDTIVLTHNSGAPVTTLETSDLARPINALLTDLTIASKTGGGTGTVEIHVDPNDARI